MKIFIRFLIVLLLVISLCSCKNESERKNISGSVMLYSSMDEETLKALKKSFETKYPGVTLDYYYSTLERVNNRLFTENSTKQLNCDVIWSGSQLDFEKYKNEGYLIPYKSKELGGIHKIFRDKDNYYTGARTAAVGFGYLNENKVKVKKYEDLLNNNYNEKVVLSDPNRATIIKYFVAAMMQNKKYGEGFFNKLYSNGVEIVNSADASKSKVENGDKLICLTIDYLNLAVKEEETFTFSYPIKDVVFFYTPVGLAKNPLNLENGKLLIDFMLSKEGQNVIASTGNLSTRKDMKNNINTQKFFSKAMNVDIKDIYENIDNYIERFNSLR